jgi:outer membrane protein TolC
MYCTNLLNKANKQFKKAIIQYENVKNAAINEADSAKGRMEQARQDLETADATQVRAQNAIDKLTEIVGE